MQQKFLAEEMYAEWLARGVDVSKMTGALAAALGGADANGISIAADTATNAAENNFIWMVPVILVGLELVDKALMAKDAYDLAEAVKNDDKEKVSKLSKALGITILVEGTVGNAIPGSNIVAKTVVKLKESGASQAVIAKVKALFGGSVPVSQVRRTELLMSVSDVKLKERINKLYRPGAIHGDGGTADAIRHEMQTGELLSKSGHFQKGQDMVNGLNKDIRSGRLNTEELNIAKAMRDDLQNALDGN